MTEHLELSRIKNRREASFSFVGKTMIPADCWGLAHCILDVGTWHYGDNMSGVRLSGLGDHLHLLNSKHYNTEKEIFSSEKYFLFFQITFSSYPLKSLRILWKEYFSFLCTKQFFSCVHPFVKVHLTNYHLSAGLREWDYPWHIHKICSSQHKKGKYIFLRLVHFWPIFLSQKQKGLCSKCH